MDTDSPRPNRLKQLAWLLGSGVAFLAVMYASSVIAAYLNFSLPLSAALGQAGFLLLAILLPRLDGGGTRNLGLLRPWKGYDALVAAGLVMLNFAGSILTAILLMSTQQAPLAEQPASNLLQSFGSYSTPTFLLIALGLALQSGITEELLFRGYLITRLERLGLNSWSCILISALAFGLIHWPGYGLLPSLSKALWFGVPTALFFWYGRRLGPLVAAHALMNFLGFTLAHLAAKLDAYL